MHEVLVNHLVGLSLPMKSVVRLTDSLDMTIDIYCGRKTTTQHNNSRSLPYFYPNYSQTCLKGSPKGQVKVGCLR